MLQSVATKSPPAPKAAAKRSTNRKIEKLDEASFNARKTAEEAAKKNDTQKLAALIRTSNTATAMTITPTMAEIMLETNTGNRNVSSSKVDEYAGAMTRGEWRLTGETIIFSKQGILNDGQHRLLACIAAKVSFVTDVRFGVERDTFECIDIGQKRTAAQVLGIEGEKYTTCLAAAVRLLISYKAKDFGFKSRAVQPAIVVDVLGKNPKLRESAKKASQAWSEFRLLPVPALCFCHFLFAKINAEEADKFLFDIGSGENMRKEDPVMALRRFATNSPVRGGTASPFWVPLIIRAWNARRAGIEIKQWRAPTENTIQHFPHPT